ncbi:Polysaccharide chain length determinant protein [Desulfosarcina cetonica]|uniref:GumC family protein n=1 Tax=Desulfosarcina cetonica TaxID=90730 RepID=UPI0006D0821C|nr:Wzz/FepE/Etk N-terminal domain-containing protein [Desulfosarcina cetonica]VTR65928.1 Polysaccharide chain length determinant protein [Desulfosarcina cetonica]
MEEHPLVLGDYVDILKRRKWALAVPAIIVVLVAGLVALLLPSIYKSSATILIEEQDIPAEFVMTTVTGYAEQRIQSTQQRIMSTGRLVEIIDRFNLYPEYKDRWTTEEIVEKMRDDIHLDLISVDTIDRRTGRPTAATIAFTLSYEGKDAATVQRVADRLVSLFLSENLEVRQRQTTETTEFLKEETDRVGAQLAELEEKITVFKAQHVNALPEMLQVNLQSLNSMETNLQRMDEQIRSLREREGYLRTQLSSIPEMEDPEKERLKVLEMELVNLKSKFTDDYPDVKKLRLEIAELESRLAKKNGPENRHEQPDNTAYITLAAQLSSTRAEIKSMLMQKTDMTAKTETYRQRIETTPKIEQAYNALLVDRNNTRAKYEDLLRKAMEANVALGLEKEQKGERFTLIDPARRPEKPFKPNRLAIGLIGVVLGIGAGVGFAAIREFSDQAVRAPQDIARISHLPLLVSIPTIMTPLDRRNLRRKRMMWGLMSVLACGVGILAFHFLVMDLDVFWAKLMRRLPPM